MLVYRYDYIRSEGLAAVHNRVCSPSLSRAPSHFLFHTQAWASIVDDFPRITQVTFFFYDSVENNVMTTFDLQNSAEISAFTAGYNNMRATAGP